MKSKKIKFVDIKGMLLEEEMKEISGGSGSYSYGSADPSSYTYSTGGGDPFGLSSINSLSSGLFSNNFQDATSALNILMNSAYGGSWVNSGDGTGSTYQFTSSDATAINNFIANYISSQTGGTGSTTDPNCPDCTLPNVTVTGSYSDFWNSNPSFVNELQEVIVYANKTDNTVEHTITAVGLMSDTQSETFTAITNLVNNAPELLDTWGRAFGIAGLAASTLELIDHANNGNWTSQDTRTAILDVGIAASMYFGVGELALGTMGLANSLYGLFTTHK